MRRKEHKKKSRQQTKQKPRSFTKRQSHVSYPDQLRRLYAQVALLTLFKKNFAVLCRALDTKSRLAKARLGILDSAPHTNINYPGGILYRSRYFSSAV
jgi:hypothetical protein